MTENRNNNQGQAEHEVAYEAPALAVVTFKTERGFAASYRNVDDNQGVFWSGGYENERQGVNWGGDY